MDELGPEQQSDKDIIDTELKRCLREDAIRGASVRFSIECLTKTIEQSLLIIGTQDAQLATSPIIDELLATAIESIRDKATKQLDMITLIQTLLLAAWRTSRAAEEAAIRVWDPASKKGPDDVLLI